MTFQERESGLLVATEKPPAPPEHPVRAVIRDALANLAGELDAFEQTCHGHIGDFCINEVAHALISCYESPGAYEISDLGQVIRGFLKGAA